MTLFFCLLINFCSIKPLLKLYSKNFFFFLKIILKHSKRFREEAAAPSVFSWILKLSSPIFQLLGLALHFFGCICILLDARTCRSSFASWGWCFLVNFLVNTWRACRVCSKSTCALLGWCYEKGLKIFLGNLMFGVPRSLKTFWILVIVSRQKYTLDAKN